MPGVLQPQLLEWVITVRWLGIALLSLASSGVALAGKKDKTPAAPAMQAPNVAAAAMVDACARTKQMGTDALTKALNTANGVDPRSQGKSVWEHFATLQKHGVTVGVDVQLPSTMKIDRAGITEFQNACLAYQSTDMK
jgi:hypothetical protein